jgi:predicted Co/Zn/Cd cation transporter (cation efflux family)
MEGIVKRFWIFILFGISFYTLFAIIGCLIPSGVEIVHNLAIAFTVVALSDKFADWIFKKE